MVYSDKLWENGVIRTFSSDIDSIELVWHRDQEDRIIKSVELTDWKIQLDNQLPIEINKEVFIKKGEWHRLIKGTGSLILTVHKLPI